MKYIYQMLTKKKKTLKIFLYWVKDVEEKHFATVGIVSAIV